MLIMLKINHTIVLIFCYIMMIDIIKIILYFVLKKSGTHDNEIQMFFCNFQINTEKTDT